MGALNRFDPWKTIEKRRRDDSTRDRIGCSWNLISPAKRAPPVKISDAGKPRKFYGPGTELQVVRREGAWFQVSDPVTKERGWVLDEYLSSIGGSTPAQVATETPNEQPTVIKPAIQKSSKRSRSAKARIRSVVIANADPWNDRWARRADRRRGFGLFMFRPVPRFAQGR